LRCAIDRCQRVAAGAPGWEPSVRYVRSSRHNQRPRTEERRYKSNSHPSLPAYHRKERLTCNSALRRVSLVRGTSVQSRYALREHSGFSTMPLQTRTVVRENELSVQWPMETRAESGNCESPGCRRCFGRWWLKAATPWQASGAESSSCRMRFTTKPAVAACWCAKIRCAVRSPSVGPKEIPDSACGQRPLLGQHARRRASSARQDVAVALVWYQRAHRTERHGAGVAGTTSARTRSGASVGFEFKQGAALAREPLGMRSFGPDDIQDSRSYFDQYAHSSDLLSRTNWDSNAPRAKAAYSPPGRSSQGRCAVEPGAAQSWLPGCEDAASHQRTHRLLRRCCGLCRHARVIASPAGRSVRPKRLVPMWMLRAFRRMVFGELLRDRGQRCCYRARVRTLRFGWNQQGRLARGC